MRTDVRAAIEAWDDEVDDETVRLIGRGVPPHDAVVRACLIVSARRLRECEETEKRRRLLRLGRL